MSISVIGTATRENAPAITSLISEMLHDSDALVAIGILVNALAYQGVGRGVPKDEFVSSITHLLSEIYAAQVESVNTQGGLQ